MNIKRSIFIITAALMVCAAPLFMATGVSADGTSTVVVNPELVGYPPPPPPGPLPPIPPPPPPPVPPMPPPPPPPPRPAPVYTQPVYPNWNLPCYLSNCNYPCNYTGCAPCPSSWRCSNVYTKVVVVEKPVVVTPVVCTPEIVSFTSVPSCVEPCREVNLLWTVKNADTITITPGIGTIPNTGSYKVTVASTTTFTLTASNSAGTVIASTMVTVTPNVVSSGTVINSAVAAGTTTASAATVSQGGLFTMGLGGSNGQFSPWLLYVLMFVVLAAVIIALVTFSRRPKAAHAVAAASGTRTGFVPWTTATMDATETQKATAVEVGSGARFVTSGGDRIAIPGYGTFLGRNDFKSILGSDKAGLVSREHIHVDVDHGDYYIEDRNSTNDTRLNGSKIKGTGRHLLKDGDIIELGNALALTFRA